MPELLHFVASWAEPICAEHRRQVSAAAVELGYAVQEIDVDEAPELARTFQIRNVPAVAVAGDPGSVVVGARAAAELVSLLRPHPRSFKALVWVNDAPAERVTVEAEDVLAARAALQETYGSGATISVWNDADANKPR